MQRVTIRSLTHTQTGHTVGGGETTCPSPSGPSPSSPSRLWPPRLRASWSAPPPPPSSALWWRSCHSRGSAWRSPLKQQQQQGVGVGTAVVCVYSSTFQENLCSDHISIVCSRVGTFLCRQLADVHGFIQDFDGERQGRGQFHLSLLEVLLQHGDGSLGRTKRQTFIKITLEWDGNILGAKEGRKCVGWTSWSPCQ